MRQAWWIQAQMNEHEHRCMWTHTHTNQQAWTHAHSNECKHSVGGHKQEWVQTRPIWMNTHAHINKHEHMCAWTLQCRWRHTGGCKWEQMQTCMDSTQQGHAVIHKGTIVTSTVIISPLMIGSGGRSDFRQKWGQTCLLFEQINPLPGSMACWSAQTPTQWEHGG